MAILFPSHGSEAKLIGWVDSDYAGDTDDRKSCTGYVFQVNSAPVSWRSKKQAVVTLSSTEAELVAATAAAQEAVFLRTLLSQLGAPQAGQTTLYEDNQGGIAMTRSGSHSTRIKHLDIKYKYIRQAIEEGQVQLEYCPTSEMLADILTNPVAKIKSPHSVRALVFSRPIHSSGRSGSVGGKRRATL